jgi:hypothetical protein
LPRLSHALESIWTQDLTQFVPLKVGERIVADASSKNAIDGATQDFKVEMKVTGVESIRI